MSRDSKQQAAGSRRRDEDRAQDAGREGYTLLPSGKWREPDWMGACKAALLKLDPRYVIVFKIRWQVFGGDCSAAQMHRYLQEQEYEWAPTSERQVRNWMKEILPIEARCKAAAPA
jgi:hypothetical protein